MINEKLINKINGNLNSYTINVADTNSEFDTNQILSSNLSFATANKDSTPDSPITPQTLLKDFETQRTKRIPNFTICFITPTKKAIETAEINSSEKHIDIK